MSDSSNDDACYRRIRRVDTPKGLTGVFDAPQMYVDYPCATDQLESCETASGLTQQMPPCYDEGGKPLRANALQYTSDDTVVKGTTNPEVKGATCYRNIRPVENPPQLQGVLGRHTYVAYDCRNADISSCSEVSSLAKTTEKDCYVLDPSLGVETPIRPSKIWYQPENPKRIRDYIVIPGVLVKSPAGEPQEREKMTEQREVAAEEAKKAEEEAAKKAKAEKAAKKKAEEEASQQEEKERLQKEATEAQAWQKEQAERRSEEAERQRREMKTERKTWQIGLKDGVKPIPALGEDTPETRAWRQEREAEKQRISGEAKAEVQRLKDTEAPPPEREAYEVDTSTPEGSPFGEYGYEWAKPTKKSFCFLF